jgi:hypothetical protein
MFALLLVWLLIAALALPLGWWLLARFDPARSVARAGDRACAALWLGLPAGCALFAALSLIVPLSASVSLLALLAALLLWRRAQTRAEAKTLCATAQSDGTLTGILALAALAVAAHATQTVTNYDPGLYHYQHIQWLSDYGVVRGMGLIHSRFGFAGTWLTLPATLNHGLLRARVATVGGGLVVLLALLQWLLCLQRCLQARACAADRYCVVAFGLMLLYVIDKGWFNATSPDAPVFALTILIAWLMLLTPRGTNALPLWLALAAFSFKLSALPLLPIAAWHAGWPLCRRSTWLAVPLVALLLAQSLISSGCLAYPLAQSCFAVDWGVGADSAARDAAAVVQWARWSALPAAGAAANWLPSWASAHDVEIALFALALLVLAGRFRRLSAITGATSVTVLALLCITLGMVSAPDVRFWGGSLFALLGLAGLLCWPVRSAAAGGATPGGVTSRAAASTAGHALQRPWFVAAACGALLAMTIVALARKPLTVLLRPPAMQMPAITLTSTAAGVAYWLPTSGNQCWAAPLPCAPARLTDDIRNRDESVGLSAGFVRVQ